MREKGKAAMEGLQATVEREWQQLKAIRRRFSGKGGASPASVRHSKP